MADDFLLPYFKIFPAETLADERFSGWTMEERGLWLTLLLRCWVNGSIPSEEGAIARMVGMNSRSFRRVFDQISDRFIAHPDLERRLTSRRLEVEREEARSKAAAGRVGATSRWNKKSGMRPHSDRTCDRNATCSGVLMPPAQPSPAHTEEACAEPDKPAAAPLAHPGPGPTTGSPVVAVLPCVGKGPSERAVTEADITPLREAYPGLDVPAEVRKARAWLIANRSRRKTYDGIPRFLMGWLNKAQNSGRNHSPRVDEYEERMRRLRDEAEREASATRPALSNRGGNGQAAAGASPARDVPKAAAALQATVGKLLDPGWEAGGVQDGASLELGFERGRTEAARTVRDPRDDSGGDGSPGGLPI